MYVPIDGWFQCSGEEVHLCNVSQGCVGLHALSARLCCAVGSEKVSWVTLSLVASLAAVGLVGHMEADWSLQLRWDFLVQCPLPLSYLIT